MKRNKKINRKLNIGENENYDKAVETLTIKFTPKLGKKIGNLYIELQLDKGNMNVDTYMSTIKDIFITLSQRNKGINIKDESFISEEDIFAFIRRYPRILKQDIIKNLVEKLDIIENLDTMDSRKINKLIKMSNGYICSIGTEKLYESCTFLDNLMVIFSSIEKQNAIEYLLLNLGESNLQVSTRKIFSRLMYICSLTKSNEISLENFNFCFKRNDEEYEKKFGISQDELYVKYVLPITSDKEEYKKRIKQSIDNVVNPQFGEIVEGEGILKED